MNGDLIPFQIETQRVVQLLAKQIYQSPLALLRENTQNAFDAIRERMYASSDFSPCIDITLTPTRITITDNGIGMTPEDLQRHYWTAGSSSKNNETARAAGVVGTFGIGAMANFGIAERLTVETESARSGDRTVCRADRARLDLRNDCIERDFVSPTGRPGTTITADISADEQIDVQTARDYIAEFVPLVDLPVRVNGEIVSQRSVEDLVPTVPEAWTMNKAGCRIGPCMTADVTVVLSNNADLWLHLTNIVWDSKALDGRLVIRTGRSNLRTFRNGFGLATASVSSFYQFGGLADLAVLEPTAGREAVTVDGLQLLQTVMVDVDLFASELLAAREECDSSTPFMGWVVAHGRYDLCGRLRMTVNPGDRVSLEEVASASKAKPMMLYGGADQGVIKAHASDDTPLLILARSNPRRQCEQGFLDGRAAVTAISDKPVVKDVRTQGELSVAESALAYRIEAILDSDYFVKCQVKFGTISHGLPAFVQKEEGRLNIILNPEGQTVELLFGLYQTEYGAFGSMAKDFARTVLFPRLADYVPSSTRQGAEAFLRAIRRPREVFEYADDDLGDLPSIWADYNDGRISLDQAVARSRAAVRSSIQVVERAISAKDVVPDVIQNEQTLRVEGSDSTLSFEPTPGITRLELNSAAKLLVIDDNEPALRGYHCFLAITDKVREDMGDFFLQPHTTSVVWGGQKTLFVFMHHSRQFGLYYDLQTHEIVAAPSGGGAYPTCSIVLKNRIYIPVPEEISASFIPATGERKRFEVRADILRTGDAKAAS